MGADLSLAFMTGLFGGFGHCIGMCGPLVASFAWKQRNAGAPAQWLPQVQYHAGRIITYTLVGAVMGLTGSFVNVAGRIAGLQNAIALLAGCMMVLMGLSIAGLWRGSALLERHPGAVLASARRFLALPQTLRSIALGLLMGLLPCGLSYTVFIAAAGAGGALPGALISFAFGLGTLPAILLFGNAAAMLGSSFRGRIYRAGGIVIIAMGILFIVRGVREHAGL